METLIVVADPARARAVIRWAGKLGQGKYTQMTVFSCFEGAPSRPRRVVRTSGGGLLQIVEDALDEQRMYSTEHYQVTGENLSKVLIGEIQTRRPEAVVVAVDGAADPESLSCRLGEGLMASAPSNVLLLDPGNLDRTENQRGNHELHKDIQLYLCRQQQH